MYIMLFRVHSFTYILSRDQSVHCLIHRLVDFVGKLTLVNVYYGFVWVGSYTIYTVHQ
uniref:Uncharacterized protein n=1 Tax=Aegilops tauschii subsp. strangulata TaxID=200361 RepID=A0A453EJA4_AEGTS